MPHLKKFIAILSLPLIFSCTRANRYTWLIMKVQDEDGNPVENAVIISGYIGFEGFNPTEFIALTDDSGYAMEWVEAGHYILEVVKTNYEEVIDTFDVLATRKVERSFTLRETPLKLDIKNVVEMESEVLYEDNGWLILFNKKLEKWSFDDPLNPYMLASIELTGSIRGFCALPNYAYVYLLNQGVKIFKFDNGSIIDAGTIQTAGVASDILIEDTLLILLEGGDLTVEIYGIGDPENPVFISAINNIELREGITWNGYIVGIGALYSPVIIDINNPQLPILVYERPSSARCIKGFNSQFYLLTYGDRLEKWELAPIALLKYYPSGTIVKLEPHSPDTLLVFDSPLNLTLFKVISLEDTLKTLSLFLPPHEWSLNNMWKFDDYIYVSSLNSLYILELTTR